MKDNKLVTFLVVGALLLVVPLFAQQFGNAWVRIIDIALLYVLLALGLNIVVGYAGLLDLDYPDVERDLNRWLPLVKWFLAIPHYVVLFFLYVALVVVVIIAWFVILFTGRYPRGMFDFVHGVIRWHNRVLGYAYILVTDRYPPFSLAE